MGLADVYVIFNGDFFVMQSQLLEARWVFSRWRSEAAAFGCMMVVSSHEGLTVQTKRLDISYLWLFPSYPKMPPRGQDNPCVD